MNNCPYLCIVSLSGERETLWRRKLRAGGSLSRMAQVDWNATVFRGTAIPDESSMRYALRTIAGGVDGALSVFNLS